MFNDGPAFATGAFGHDYGNRVTPRRANHGKGNAGDTITENFDAGTDKVEALLETGVVSRAVVASFTALLPAAKAVLELHTQLRVAEPEDMTPDRLAELGTEIARLAGLIADAYFV